ncbi:hypothetical protein GCM10010495_77220 [Kitasatospora herbaricolor]|nr:hypothetical protein GCM10010495_77220 [Kitasatospora herbaricolor]
MVGYLLSARLEGHTAAVTGARGEAMTAWANPDEPLRAHPLAQPPLSTRTRGCAEPAAAWIVLRSAAPGAVCGAAGGRR